MFRVQFPVIERSGQNIIHLVFRTTIASLFVIKTSPRSRSREQFSKIPNAEGYVVPSVLKADVRFPPAAARLLHIVRMLGSPRTIVVFFSSDGSEALTTRHELDKTPAGVDVRFLGHRGCLVCLCYTVYICNLSLNISPSLPHHNKYEQVNK